MFLEEHYGFPFSREQVSLIIRETELEITKRAEANEQKVKSI